MSGCDLIVVITSAILERSGVAEMTQSEHSWSVDKRAACSEGQAAAGACLPLEPDV